MLSYTLPEEALYVLGGNYHEEIEKICLALITVIACSMFLALPLMGADRYLDIPNSATERTGWYFFYNASTGIYELEGSREVPLTASILKFTYDKPVDFEYASLTWQEDDFLRDYGSDYLSLETERLS